MQRIIKAAYLVGCFVLTMATTFSLVSAQGVIDLPQTGQTICYDTGGNVIECAGTGQDGEWKAGVEWPNPRFTVSGDCVTDNLTGLMWAKNANLPNGTRTWQGALDFVASINAGAGLCGYHDWRLPNINELESLVNAGEYNWLNNKGFINVQIDRYWSSTADASYPAYAWFVTMCCGDVYYGSRSYYFSVWSVRSGQLNNSDAQYPANVWKTGQTTSYVGGDDGDLERGVAWPALRFSDHGDGTVTDNLTGLMWAKNANLPNGTRTWQGALDYINDMNKVTGLGGYHDWRLPNRKELFGLVDHSRYNPALPADHLFQNVQSEGHYWSSTTHEFYTAYAWVVYMGWGLVVYDDKSYYSFYVWPVRSGTCLENPPPTGSGVIEGGALYTNTNSVFISISATDSDGVTEMCVSNAPSCTSWEPYQTSKLWTLSSGDGTKTVYMWFKDGVGNVNSSPFTDTITLDTTQPTDPTTVSSTSHNVNTWTSNRNITMSWSGAMDAHSGVYGYSYEFSQSPSTLPDTTVETQGGSATSGSLADGNNWYFHIRTTDNAGNWTSTVHRGPYYIDGTVPLNPTSATETHGVADNTWQNTVGDPAFSWSWASDSGSGIKGNYWYFGTDSSADPVNWTTTAGCDPSSISSGTYYLRVKTEDNAGNLSSPVTLFTFKYDGTPPTSGSISINNGAPTTLSLMANLSNLGAIDMNGLSQMRFSNNPSGPWTSPEPYASTKTDWDLSSFGGHSAPGNKTVFVKYQDNVGNWSDPFLGQICYQPLQSFPFTDDFSTEKGWFGYELGGWERLPALSGGGENGYPDPGVDYSASTDNNILGFAIGADYPNDLVEKSIISPPIDCTGQDEVFLKFRRHLNVEGNGFDHARIYVSVNGTDWTQVWENPPIDLADNEWVPFVLDISEIAANQATVYIRFTMGQTNSLRRFSGWNIDDFEITSGAVFPSEGTYGTELVISGSGFGSKKGKVSIGSTALTVSGSGGWMDDLIKGSLKKVISPGIYDVVVQPVGPKGTPTIVYKEAFVVRAAEIHSIERDEGAAYDKITIKGKYFGTSKGKVYLEYEKSGGLENVRKSCTVSDWDMDTTTGDSQIVFVVPVILPAVCDVIVDPYSTIAETEEEDGFSVKAPEIESVDPKTGSVGEEIIILGNYFGPPGKGGKVYLGYVSKGKATKKSCSVVSWDDDEIVFIVPKLPVGAYDVIVTNVVDSAQYGQKFNIK